MQQQDECFTLNSSLLKDEPALAAAIPFYPAGTRFALAASIFKGRVARLFLTLRYVHVLALVASIFRGQQLFFFT